VREAWRRHQSLSTSEIRYQLGKHVLGRSAMLTPSPESEASRLRDLFE
jgi:hypothetical protein